MYSINISGPEGRKVDHKKPVLVTYNKWDSEHLQIWGQIQNILRHHSIEITIYPK